MSVGGVDRTVRSVRCFASRTVPAIYDDGGRQRADHAAVVCKLVGHLLADLGAVLIRTLPGRLGHSMGLLLLSSRLLLELRLKVICPAGL